MREYAENMPFSRIDQIGVIVKDMHRAIEYYQTLGIGPFHNLNLTLLDREVYGKPAHDVRNLVRVARLGRLQFELIQPVSGESVQKKFLETRGEGINHVAFFISDINKENARMEALGFKRISGGRFPGGGGVSYFDTDRLGGIIFELIEWPPGFDPLG